MGISIHTIQQTRYYTTWQLLVVPKLDWKAFPSRREWSVDRWSCSLLTHIFKFTCVGLNVLIAILVYSYRSIHKSTGLKKQIHSLLLHAHLTTWSWSHQPKTGQIRVSTSSKCFSESGSIRSHRSQPSSSFFIYFFGKNNIKRVALRLMRVISPWSHHIPSDLPTSFHVNLPFPDNIFLFPFLWRFRLENVYCYVAVDLKQTILN